MKALKFPFCCAEPFYIFLKNEGHVLHGEIIDPRELGRKKQGEVPYQGLLRVSNNKFTYDGTHMTTGDCGRWAKSMDLVRAICGPISSWLKVLHLLCE